MRSRRPVSPVAALLLCSCTGSIGDVPEGAHEHGLGASVTPETCEGRPPSVGAAPLLRVTRRQYAFTVLDLFGAQAPTDQLPVDGSIGGFPGNAGAPNESQSVTRYSEVAAALAPVIDTGAISSCAADGCASDAVSALGLRMFRRPLRDEEAARYEGLFFVGRDELDLDVAGSKSLLVEAMLQSPSFLVRGEEAVAESAEGPVLLNGYELASRLSHFLHQSTPSAELLEAAAAGRLDTVEGIEEVAREMLADPKAERALVDFHLSWLWLRTGDGEHWSSPPGIDPELYQSMLDETEAFVVHVAREGTFDDLLTASWTYADAAVADVYGLATRPSGLTRVDLDPEERSGILTQPLFVATHNRTERLRPVPLGHMIRARLLCEGLPPPPPNVPELQSDPTLSAREIAALHEADPACGSCHRLMDPIGFAWSHYDNLGRFHTDNEDGTPIDASGELIDAGDASGVVDGATDIGRLFAGSEKVRGCYVESWLAYALGRTLEDLDACSRVSVFQRFERSGHRIEELILGIVTSDAFRYRAVSPPTTEEVCR